MKLPASSPWPASSLSACPQAQSTVTTERTVEPTATTVETRVVKTADGKTVTEKITTTTQRESESVARTYSAAIVVSNRAGAQYDDQLAPLEDLLAARLADLGFQLVSRELVTSNLRSFVPPGAPADSESARAAAAAEAALLDQSSALRLAQALGTDYVLHASITSFAETQRNVTAYGQSLANHDFTLRVAYKILDAQGGGA